MSQLRGEKLRIHYSVLGRLKFLSLLETTELWERVMRQARTNGIDLLLTEGFNPRIKMSFSPPRSVGMESLCEYLDVSLDLPVDGRLDRGGEPTKQNDSNTANTLDSAISDFEQFLNTHLPAGFAVIKIATDAPKFNASAVSYEYKLFFPSSDLSKPLAALKAIFRSNEEFIIDHKDSPRTIRIEGDVTLDQIEEGKGNGTLFIRATHSLSAEKQITPSILFNVIKTHQPFYFEVENIRRSGFSSSVSDL